MSWKPALPRLTILDWARGYKGSAVVDDSVAAAIVTVMVIPQSLAYALLAGLPPEVGLYAGMVPPILYALFGTSGALAVGPVAVVSLMTAATVGEFAKAGSAAYLDVALALALLSGVMLSLMGILRLGFLANFLSHPVISGFVTASGLLIAASQFKTLMGVGGGGHTLPEMLQSLWQEASHTHRLTLISGLVTVAFLFWVRQGLKPLLVRMGLSPRAADLGAKMGPVAAIIVTTALSAGFDWASLGVKVVGSIPQGHRRSPRRPGTPSCGNSCCCRRCSSASWASWNRSRWGRRWPHADASASSRTRSWWRWGRPMWARPSPAAIRYRAAFRVRW